MLGRQVYKSFKGAIGKETEKIIPDKKTVKSKGLNFKNQPWFCPVESSLLIRLFKRQHRTWMVLQLPHRWVFLSLSKSEVSPSLRKYFPELDLMNDNHFSALNFAALHHRLCVT